MALVEGPRNQIIPGTSSWHWMKESVNQRNTDTYESSNRVEAHHCSSPLEMENASRAPTFDHAETGHANPAITTPPLEQYPRYFSKHDPTFGPKMTQAETDRWRKLLGARIAALAKLQDRVVSLQVQSQGKRTALHHLRENLAQQYDLIWNYLQEHENERQYWASEDLKVLHSAIRSTRRELSPAEKDFLDLEQKLYDEERVLAEGEEKLRARCYSHDDDALTESLESIRPKYEKSTSRDEVSTSIGFESSSISGSQHPPVTVDSDHSLERYVDQSDTPWNLFHSSSNHRLLSRPSEVEMTTLVDKISHFRQVSRSSSPHDADKPQSDLRWRQDDLRQYAPDLEFMADNYLAKEAP